MYLSFRAHAVFLVLLIVTWTVACSDQISTGTVNGDVSLDGAPLADGVVRFVPVDGKSQTASIPVKDGKFTLDVPIGVVRVEFSSPRVIGKRKAYDTPDSPVIEETVERIPARFNSSSELKMTVQKGVQEGTFELKSK